MKPEAVLFLLEAINALIRRDPEAAGAATELGKRIVQREEERCAAKRDGREACLVPVALVQPSLADMGIHVVGCSACRVTPTNRECPVCGNMGVAPIRKRKARR